MSGMIFEEAGGARRQVWQPFVTAPRDRTTFDVWVPEDDGGYRITDLYFSERGLLMRGGAPAELPRWPAYWMPLPPAPSPDTDHLGGVGV